MVKKLTWSCFHRIQTKAEMFSSFCNMVNSIMATLYDLCLRNSFKNFYVNQLEMTPLFFIFSQIWSLYTLNICFSLYLSSNTVPNLPFVLMTDTWAFISDLCIMKLMISCTCMFYVYVFSGLLHVYWCSIETSLFAVGIVFVHAGSRSMHWP